MDEEVPDEDLLIFKIRSKDGNAVSPGAPKQELVMVKNQSADPAVASERLERFGIDSAEEEARQMDRSAERPAPAGRQAAVAVQPKQESMQQPQAAKPSPQKAMKEKKKLVGPIMCVNHPWREAYATCDVCKLNFCFADIMEYGGRYYCLSDIDKAAGFPISESGHRITGFVLAASLTMLFVSLLIGYFMYPQFIYFINYMEAHGVSFTTQALTTQSFYVLFASTFLEILALYSLPVVNMLLALFCFISAIVLLRNTQKASLLATVVIGLAMIVMSYEYLTSPIFLSVTSYNIYQVVSVAFLFVTLAFIIIGRSSALSELRRQEQYSGSQVNWPGIGTY